MVDFRRRTRCRALASGTGETRTLVCMEWPKQTGGDSASVLENLKMTHLIFDRMGDVTITMQKCAFGDTPSQSAI